MPDEDTGRTLWSSLNRYETDYPSLCENLSVDVAIIGGGIMGLSTALRLAAKGVHVCVLEAATIGWGASGRNNGQVIPGLKHDPDYVIKQLGSDRGERLIELSGRAPDRVFSLIEQYDIDCDGVRNGWIQAAPDAAAQHIAEGRMTQWQRRGAPVDMIAGDDLSKRLGTDWYAGAWIDRRGGAVNPLAYTCGLAAAAVTEGALIFTESPVTALKRRGNVWNLATVGGQLQAARVILCTNAYRDVPGDGARTSIIPVRTAQIASPVLSESQWQTILPGGEVASDTCSLLTSFRLTPDKRLIMGGADATGGGEHGGLFHSLTRAARIRFPQLDATPPAYGWSGYLAITKDHLPRIFDLDHGMLAPVGCNGRGIALSTVVGEQVAELVMAEGSGQESPLPVSGPRPFFFHRLRHLGIAAHVRYSRFRDRFL